MKNKFELTPEEIESLDIVCDYLRGEESHFKAHPEEAQGHIWPHVDRLNKVVDRLIGIE